MLSRISSFVFFFLILQAFGSCTCTAGIVEHSDETDGNVLGSGSATYDCTCDETTDCASAHVSSGGQYFSVLVRDVG